MYEGIKHIFKRTFTMKYPYQKLRLPTGFRGRHLLYLDKCTGCGICAWICPERCISMVPVTNDKNYPQNPEKRFPQYWYARCCFCHFCTDYCPTGALDYTPDYELAEYDRELTPLEPRETLKTHDTRRRIRVGHSRQSRRYLRARSQNEITTSHLVIAYC